MFHKPGLILRDTKNGQAIKFQKRISALNNDKNIDALLSVRNNYLYSF
jgi:hypothetical protein